MRSDHRTSALPARAMALALCVAALLGGTTCTDDPTPNIWTKILSGTELCPEAPADFACPASGPGGGNTEVAACS